MFLQRTRLIAVLATTVNMGNAYDNQDNKVGDVLKQMDMKSSTTRSLDNIFQDVQEGSSSSNQDTAPPVPIQEANDDVSVADQHNTGLVAESGGDVAVASIAILLDCAPTPKPTTNKKGKSVKTATSKPTNSKSSKSKLTLSPTHQPTSQPDNDAITDMTTTHDTAPAPAPIQNVNDVSVNDHDTVLVAESGGSVVAVASIPIILGDSSPTPQPTRYKKGKSVKTATTSKPTNSKSAKSKLTISPTHQPTSQPDSDAITDMTTTHDTAPAPAPIRDVNDVSVNDHDAVLVAESGGSVVALASIPIILGDSSPTPQPTRYKKGKSVKTATTSKPTNSKSSKSKLTISPTHQPTSQPDKAEESMDMTTNHDTAPAPIQEMTNTKVEKEEVKAVPESDSGAASYSDSILIASVVVLPKSSKARMSMNQYDGFIGV